MSDNCISQCEGGDCLRMVVGTHCAVPFDKTWHNVAHSQYIPTAFFEEGNRVQIKASVSFAVLSYKYDVWLSCVKLSWCLVSLSKTFQAFHFPISENELLESHPVSA